MAASGWRNPLTSAIHFVSAPLVMFNLELVHNHFHIQHLILIFSLPKYLYVSLGTSSQSSSNIAASNVEFSLNLEDIQNFASFENSQTSEEFSTELSSPNSASSLAEWAVTHKISHRAINYLLHISKRSVSSTLHARTFLKIGCVCAGGTDG